MNEPILTCRGLTKLYGSMPAINELTVDIFKGKIVGLLGPNGSGKTTLIKPAAGLLQPSSGVLTVSGMPVGVETKKRVSYLPDRDYLPGNMRARELLKMFSDFYEDFDQQKAIEMLSRLGIDLSKRFRTMSKGTREKVQLSLVMSRQADLYLLDEPIAAVDPAARDYILRTVIQNYKEGSTVLISTHLIADVEPVLDDVLMMQNGTIRLYGPAAGIRAEAGKSIDMLFREVYQC